MMKKLKYKYYNKRNTTHDNGTVQSHDKKKSKSNSNFNANSGAHIVAHGKIIKSPLNKNNPATIKSK